MPCQVLMRLPEQILNRAIPNTMPPVKPRDESCNNRFQYTLTLMPIVSNIFAVFFDHNSIPCVIPQIHLIKNFH